MFSHKFYRLRSGLKTKFSLLIAMLNKPKVNYFIFSCYNGEGKKWKVSYSGHVWMQCRLDNPDITKCCLGLEKKFVMIGLCYFGSCSVPSTIMLKAKNVIPGFTVLKN